MKKFLVFMVAIIATFTLAACQDTTAGDVNVDPDNDYYATGLFAEWANAIGNEDYLMTAIARNDERVKSIASKLKGARWVYICEITLPDDVAEWNATYKIDGEEKSFDGHLTVKFLQVPKGEEVPNWWGQSPESGKFRNLTTDTLYLPPFQHEDDTDGAGGWNDNPVAFEAGTYYIVYAQFKVAEHGIALIKKP